MRHSSIVNNNGSNGKMEKKETRTQMSVSRAKVSPWVGGDWFVSRAKVSPHRCVGDGLVHALNHRSPTVNDGNAFNISWKVDVERRDLRLVGVGMLAVHAHGAGASVRDAHALWAIALVDQQRTDAVPTWHRQVGNAATLAWLVRAVRKFVKFVVHIRGIRFQLYLVLNRLFVLKINFIIDFWADK